MLIVFGNVSDYTGRAIKLIGVRQSIAIRDHLGVSPRLWRVIGTLEILGVVGALAGVAKWASLGVAAALGLATVSLGAIIVHVRAGDRFAQTAPAVLATALAIATVTALAT
jgi:hypothetical protein